MELFLSVLDQVRYIVGNLIAIVLLCHGILPARPGYRRRLALGSALALLLALLFVPLSRAFGTAFACQQERGERQGLRAPERPGDRKSVV